MPYVRLLLPSPSARPHDVKVLPSVQCGQVQPGSCSCVAALPSFPTQFAISQLYVFVIATKQKQNTKYNKKKKEKIQKKKVNLPCGNLHFNCHLTRTNRVCHFFPLLLLRCCCAAASARFLLFMFFRVLSPQKVKK